MSQAKGIENIRKLQDFFDAREKEGDWEDYVRADGLDLNKTLVAEDAGLNSRKTPTEGKAISKVYFAQIINLVERGILKEDLRTPEEKITSKTKAKIDSLQLKRANKIAETNAALEEELFQERKKNEQLEKKLKRLEKIEAYMEQTGRW